MHYIKLHREARRPYLASTGQARLENFTLLPKMNKNVCKILQYFSENIRITTMYLSTTVLLGAFSAILSKIENLYKFNFGQRVRPA